MDEKSFKPYVPKKRMITPRKKDVVYNSVPSHQQQWDQQKLTRELEKILEFERTNRINKLRKEKKDGLIMSAEVQCTGNDSHIVKIDEAIKLDSKRCIFIEYQKPTDELPRYYLLTVSKKFVSDILEWEEAFFSWPTDVSAKKDKLRHFSYGWSSSNKEELCAFDIGDIEYKKFSVQYIKTVGILYYESFFTSIFPMETRSLTFKEFEGKYSKYATGIRNGILIPPHKFLWNFILNDDWNEVIDKVQKEYCFQAKVSLFARVETPQEKLALPLRIFIETFHKHFKRYSFG